jgi:regulator of sigma E protease
MTPLLSSTAGSLGVAAVTVLAFGLLIVIHEAGHFALARLCGMRVERFSIGFGPVLWSGRRGQTEWCLSALPLGGYVRIAGMAPGEDVDPADSSAYANQPAWRRLLVILAGPAMNYVAAVALATALIASLGRPQADPSATAGEVLPGSPAEQAGLRAGDRILSVAGKPVEGWAALVAEVRGHPAQEIEIEVRRTGAPPDAPPTSLRARPEDVGGVGRLGLAPSVVAVRAPPGEALLLGAQRTNAKAGEILAGLGQVITRKQRAELRGPVGIAQEMARSAKAGAAPFLVMVWFISIVLALFNLFPIPALDGGRLIFLVYEIVTRRRVNQRVEATVHLIGFLALIGLLLAVTLFGDLARILRG